MSEHDDAWERMRVYGMEVKLHMGIGAVTLDGVFTVSDLEAIIARLEGSPLPLDLHDEHSAPYVPTLEDLNRRDIVMIKQLSIDTKQGLKPSWSLDQEQVLPFVSMLMTGGTYVEDFDSANQRALTVMIRPDDIITIRIDSVAVVPEGAEDIVTEDMEALADLDDDGHAKAEHDGRTNGRRRVARGGVRHKATKKAAKGEPASSTKGAHAWSEERRQRQLATMAKKRAEKASKNLNQVATVKKLRQEVPGRVAPGLDVAVEDTAG